ncbi:MAG: zinc metallopeptidase [Oscillospiraceae bacterium]|nr:zinc metallopeptidase [Oscillospiraceae bacterium]
MDISYFILVIPAFLISLGAQFLVNSTFKRYSQVRNYRGLTGADAATRVLNSHGVYGVRVEPIQGNLTDHYDPRTNVIRLSDSVYQSTSVAAVGVACHEAGHAVQYAEHYVPIKLRAAIIPVTNIGSSIGLVLAFVGLWLVNNTLAIAGIILFSTVVLFQLLTLPVEFNASARALKTIKNDSLLEGEEYDGAKKVLQAAALTYVAAMLTSLMNLLRLILLLQGNNRRRR